MAPPFPEEPSSQVSAGPKITGQVSKALQRLDERLQTESLPHKLELGLTNSQRLSIGALTGLFASKSENVSLPLASWGAGTRRMATLQIAAATESSTRISVVDELERGLEPYRVRRLVAALQADASQSFVTTHSPIAIEAATEARLWYLDSTGNIGSLPHKQIAALQRRDPATFLSRFSVICEGQTEIGFVSRLLDLTIDGQFRDQGVHLADGQGNQSTLSILEAMGKAGLSFAGFADNEGREPGRWRDLKDQMNERLFQWQSGCLEENIVRRVDAEQLAELFKDEDGVFDGSRLRTVADRLCCAEKDLETIESAAAVQGKDLRTLIIAAATGDAEGAPVGDEKSWKNGHPKQWFKSKAGGRELADKMIALAVWPVLKPILLPFLNSVRQAAGQEELQDLPNER